jgi:hypothetical protein
MLLAFKTFEVFPLTPVLDLDNCERFYPSIFVGVEE